MITRMVDAVRTVLKKAAEAVILLHPEAN